MTDDSAETDQRGKRRPYVKPFVRNLDAMDTEGKTSAGLESTITTIHGGERLGPS
jgi:hypothetical protein